jgi:hypothetical protein
VKNVKCQLGITTFNSFVAVLIHARPTKYKVLSEMTRLFCFIIVVSGVLAQLVEQWTLNPFVASSILARPTKNFTKKRCHFDRLSAGRMDIGLQGVIF